MALPEFIDSPKVSSTPVRVIEHTVDCTNCQSGKLVYDGKNREIGGNRDAKLQFRHRCDYCKEGTFLPNRYPLITYEPIEQMQLVNTSADLRSEVANDVERTNEQLT